MIATSSAYKAAVKAQGRQTAMRVYVPTVSDNVELFGESGSINRAARRKNYPDSDSVPLNEIALLDGSWQLGVKPITSMGATELGFISAKLSDDEGDFAANDRLTILMAAYDSELEEYGLDYFDFKGLAIEFKNDKGGHPTDFSVELMYHDYTRFNYSLTDYDSDHWEMDDLHEDVYRILITIKGWSLPNAHAVISRISFAGDIVLTDDDIVKATLIENMGYDSTTGLPTLSNNTLEVEFDKQILDGFIPPKGVTLRAEIGVYTAEDKIEYVPCGEFKLDEYSQSDYEMTAQIKAFDKLYGWGEDTWYCPRYALFNDNYDPPPADNELVKERYRQMLPDIIFDGDPLPSNKWSQAYIPSRQSKLEALTTLMALSCTYVYTGREGIIAKSFTSPRETPLDISYDDIYSVKKTADYSVKRLEYVVHSGERGEDLGDDGDYLEFEVSSADVVESAVGGTAPDFSGNMSLVDLIFDTPQKHDWAFLSVRYQGEDLAPDAYTAYKDCVILHAPCRYGVYRVIYGGPKAVYDYTATPIALNPLAAKGLALRFESFYFYVEEMDVGFGDPWWRDNYDEWLPLFWDTVNAIRYEYEVTWRGNPALELGDKMRFEDSKGIWRTGYVFANEYTYEGYLKCKTIIRSDT